MELKTFITEVLVQIQEGVQDAIDKRMESAKNTGAINPHFSEFTERTQDIVEKVEFDVAITAADGNVRSGQAGIKVWSLGFGGKLEGTTENSVVSRIKFAVPIVSPMTRIHLDETKAKEAESERVTAAMQAAARRVAKSIA